MHDHNRQSGTPWYRTPPATPSSAMRVSDTERIEVTDALCRHFAEGRLDQAELDDRTGRGAAAKTRGDLALLLRDLPRLDRDLPEPPRSSGPIPVRPLALGVLAVLCGLWLLAGTAHTLVHPHLPWVLPLHPHVPWLVVVVVLFVLARRRHRRHPHGHR